MKRAQKIVKDQKTADGQLWADLDGMASIQKALAHAARRAKIHRVREVLAAFRRVDAFEAHANFTAVPHDADCVSVDDGDDSASEARLLSPGEYLRADEQR
jgi:hypothetical protein